jgi:hypothetical protein
MCQRTSEPYKARELPWKYISTHTFETKCDSKLLTVSPFATLPLPRMCRHFALILAMRLLSAVWNKKPRRPPDEQKLVTWPPCLWGPRLIISNMYGTWPNRLFENTSFESLIEQLTSGWLQIFSRFKIKHIPDFGSNKDTNTPVSVGYNKTNVMQFSFNLLRIKDLYMFRALLALPQEVLHKRHLVHCVRIMSVAVPRLQWTRTAIVAQPTDIIHTHYTKCHLCSLLRMSK